MRNMNQLRAKVAAVNCAHSVAKSLYAELAKVFRPLVGKKVEKADGSLLASVEKLLPAAGLPKHLGVDSSVRVWKKTSNYTLGWGLSVYRSIPGESGGLYHDDWVCVGELENGVLTRLFDAPNDRDDYTAEEMKAAFDKCEAAQKALSEAKGALGPFHDML